MGSYNLVNGNVRAEGVARRRTLQGAERRRAGDCTHLASVPVISLNQEDHECAAQRVRNNQVLSTSTGQQAAL